MYKIVFVASILLIICLVNGDHDPDSETEHVGKEDDAYIKQMKNMLNKIAEETKKLRDMLDSTKNNMANGQKSDLNINKLLVMPKEVANLTQILQSTINALENKELLA